MRQFFPLAALLLIVVTVAPAAPQTEGTLCTAEPTDQPISYGDLITCRVDPVGDHDSYRFLSNGNERIWIRCARMTGPYNFEPCIDLVSPSSSTTTTCAYNTNLFVIVATLNEPGMYMVRVRDYANDNVGDYMLMLERLLPNPSSARPIQFAETLSDRVDPVGDGDLFTFDGVAGSIVTVTTSRTGGPYNFEPCVVIHAPDSTYTYDCRYNTNTLSVQRTLTLTGSYTVAVADYAGDNPGNYTITLGCLGGPCAADQATTTVAAGASWVNSGVSVSGGQVVAIRATASWQTNAAGPAVGPMGVAEPCASCPINANRGAVIARIGSNPPFFVGEGFGFRVNPAWSGALQYQINDDVLGDNSGSAAVHVLYSSPPLGAERPGETGGSVLLDPPAPNPFAESTQLRFTVSERSRVSLHVHDMAGRLVRAILTATPLEAGEHSVRWDGRAEDGARVAPGVYFYSLQVGGRELSRRAILLD